MIRRLYLVDAYLIDGQDFGDEDGERLPCCHAGDAVVLHQHVLARQPGPRRVLPALDRRPKVRGDLAVPRRVLRHDCGTDLTGLGAAIYLEKSTDLASHREWATQPLTSLERLS